MLPVRWYLRYGLSYRDVEELLAERGIEVDHVTIYRWVQRFTPLLIDAARPRRHIVGGRWFVDETYVKVAGKWRYVYRAVDEHSQVIDVFVSRRRDLRSGRTFFRRGSDQCEASRQTGPHRWSSGAMHSSRTSAEATTNSAPKPDTNTSELPQHSTNSHQRCDLNRRMSATTCVPTIQRRNSALSSVCRPKRQTLGPPPSIDYRLSTSLD